jgi:acetoin utilization deacetylase AcuC-like enzyme
MSLGYVLDEAFTAHRPPHPHPERPERITAVRDALRAARLEARGTALPVREAREEELGLVHWPGYVTELTRTVPGQSGWLDADTYYSPGTWDAAVKAAAAVVDLTTAVLDGRFRRGMALVRPPGHHAEADRAMGFCLINNVAVAAATARARGAARVAILDWDVHHGNGTQHMFEEDPTVLYLSSHQYPYYPGTGGPGEVGTGAGRGATVNVGLPAGSGDAEYAAVFDEVFVPALRRFRPDILLVSAGFDAYVDDPLAGMRVSIAGYQAMARAVTRVVDEVCEGRIVCALEGGYHLTGLGSGMVAVLDALDGRGQPEGRRPATSDEGTEAGVPESGGASDRAIMAGARAAIDQTLAALAGAGGVPAP